MPSVPADSIDPVIGALSYFWREDRACSWIKGKKRGRESLSRLNQSRLLGSWCGKFLRTFRSKSKFERSFEPDDTAGQVFDVVLLLGDSGGELFGMVGFAALALRARRRFCARLINSLRRRLYLFVQF